LQIIVINLWKHFRSSVGMSRFEQELGSDAESRFERKQPGLIAADMLKLSVSENLCRLGNNRQWSKSRGVAVRSGSQRH
jgi:hypothetical protein